MNSQEEINYFLKLIRKGRKNFGINQEQAAARIGCNQSQYSKKEKGIQQFTLEEYVKMCAFVGVTLKADLCGHDPPMEIGLKGRFCHYCGHFIADEVGRGGNNSKNIVMGMP